MYHKNIQRVLAIKKRSFGNIVRYQNAINQEIYFDQNLILEEIEKFYRKKF